MATRIQRTRIHEAAHAIAAALLRFQITEIVATAKEGCVKHQRDGDMHGEQLADALLSVIFAGPHAEAKLLKRTYWPRRSDFVNVLATHGITSTPTPLPRRFGADPLDFADGCNAAFILNVGTDETEADRIQHWHLAQSRAASLVADNWQTITALADHLATVGRMDGHAFTKWMASHAARVTGPTEGKP